MRTFIVVSVAAMGLVLAASRAEASVESCAQVLLESPGDALYSDLQVTPFQARQIYGIRSDTDQRRAQLQAQLDAVQGQLDQLSTQGGFADQYTTLESQQSSLLQQLAGLEAAAEARVAGVLSSWQRDRCNGDDEQPMVVASAPVITVAAPLPAPVAIYRRPVGRYPVAYPVPYPVRRPILARRVVHAAPVFHGRVAIGHPGPVFHGGVAVGRPGPVPHGQVRIVAQARVHQAPPAHHGPRHH
jgi:hypothetical protein